MSWNYRVIKFDDHYALHEVYYDAGGKVTAYTERPADFGSDEEEGVAGIVASLEMALSDAQKRPVLMKSDLP